MPISVADLASNRAKVTRTFASGSLTIEYDPNLITEATFAQLERFSTANQSLAAGFQEFNRLLLSLITSWDLLEKDEVTVVPLTEERLASLAIPIRSLVLQMIVGDVRPETFAPQNQE